MDDDDEAEDDPEGIPEPTQAKPGSQEKIEILRQRVELGVQLWHPNDSAIEVSDVGFED